MAAESRTNFNPLAPRGARQRRILCEIANIDISIHSPLAGRDATATYLLETYADFNPLAPRGARLKRPEGVNIATVFQSTRPSRGETEGPGQHIAERNISIHSPLAGRDLPEMNGILFPFSISIHSPLAGRDCTDGYVRRAYMIFQSTRPSRGETSRGIGNGQRRRNFNPLAPRGARLPRCSSWTMTSAFQSTRPSRGETYDVDTLWQGANISIHSPLAGRDP